MIHIETRLLDYALEAEWWRPERMVPLGEEIIPPGCGATGNMEGVVLLDMCGTTVLDHTYDTNVYLWWSFFLGSLETLIEAPDAPEDFHFPDQPLQLHMRRREDWITCSLDYRNSRTHERVQVSATGPFDELLRKSFDEAERFYRRLIELDPQTATINLQRLRQYVLGARQRLGILPWSAVEPGLAPQA